MTTRADLDKLALLIDLLNQAQHDHRVKVLSLTYSVDTIQLTYMVNDPVEGIAYGAKAWLASVHFEDTSDLLSELWSADTLETIDLSGCFN
jgi:hypothetical protein